MGKPSFLVPASARARVDRVAKKLAAGALGRVTERSNATRLIILRGLERVEGNPVLAYRPSEEAARGATGKLEETLGFQAEPDLITRIGRLVEVMRARMPPGVTVRRPDALRAALFLGLEVVEPELELTGTRRRRRSETR